MLVEANICMLVAVESRNGLSRDADNLKAAARLPAPEGNLLSTDKHGFGLPEGALRAFFCPLHLVLFGRLALRDHCGCLISAARQPASCTHSAGKRYVPAKCAADW